MIDRQLQEQIIFKNNDILVAIKRPGQLSTPSRSQKVDKRSVLGLELQKFVGLQIFPVHRLDFEVGGLILYALNPKAHQVSQLWFSEKKNL